MTRAQTEPSYKNINRTNLKSLGALLYGISVTADITWTNMNKL